MMRIALNFLGYRPGCGGVETYVMNLLSSLQHVDRDNEYLVLCDEIAVQDLMPVKENFRLRVFRYQQSSMRWVLRGLIQRTTGIDILERELYPLQVNVMHHPLTVLNPPGLPYPAVLTFHDMQEEFFPQFFSHVELRKRKVSYLPSVREARAVITVSAHAKTCLVERYGIAPGKIHVVHSGCGSQFSRIEDSKMLGNLTLKYKLLRPFMIYPAATWPHKNHQRLLAALRILIDRGRFDGELLLTGASMTIHDDVLGEIDRLGLTGAVRWLGYVPREDIPCLYNLARLMVFPSLFEGFGLPVVEAMACGCPVVCSNATSLPEIAGEAALFFDPSSIEDMAEAISRVWENTLLQEMLRQKGQERSSHFLWEDAAAKTLDVYRLAAG
jgi:glycosyltransferase involved in cell wall biosynthesis